MTTVETRVDAPAPQAAPPRSVARSALRSSVPIIGALAGFVALWYAVTYLLLPAKQRLLLPPPHEVYGGAFSNPQLMGPMMEALARSFAVALVGLAIAVVLGISYAVVMSQWAWAEKVLYPYAVILQTIPILALVPLIGIWLGYSFLARVAVCVIIALFPMVANTLFGLQSASAAAHDLFTLNKATRWQRLMKLQFPAAVPSIFTGLRNAAGLSVIGAIVGDYFFQQGAPGIGGLLRVYTQRLQMEALLTSVTLTALFGVVIFTIFAVLDRAVVGRWYGRVAR
ncbi:NitT/TauT family transport system permease protein [Pseudonocardia hierapolitana]|uniref:NitT/TauT family transport system permease protein n=1 Tax=Pseudonocardia hierapolitana TaxID=1128676 RepID=A0A561SPD5_9PSEU|nr:ABC transporter permease subunit [Pseudonocardia hierapolitana]TWF76721.1 NitT/TauT family transport system permease protein [Pseudonocardia hierapolitana]